MIVSLVITTPVNFTAKMIFAPFIHYLSNYGEKDNINIRVNPDNIKTLNDMSDAVATYQKFGESSQLEDYANTVSKENKVSNADLMMSKKNLTVYFRNKGIDDQEDNSYLQIKDDGVLTINIKENKIIETLILISKIFSIYIRDKKSSMKDLSNTCLNFFMSKYTSEYIKEENIELNKPRQMIWLDMMSSVSSSTELQLKITKLTSLAFIAAIGQSFTKDEENNAITDQIKHNIRSYLQGTLSEIRMCNNNLLNNIKVNDAEEIIKLFNYKTHSLSYLFG